MRLRRTVLRVALLVFTTSAALFAQTHKAPTQEPGWPTYGGDAGGQRYSAAAQITRANVRGLHPVWTYHTHALESGNLAVARSDFEATPILFDGVLYLTTPFDRIIALDPATGVERWTYDPRLARNIEATNYTSRGVAAWKDKSGTGDATCARRIFVATLNARLIAVDAATGKPCSGFGTAGSVDLTLGIATRADHPHRFFGNTSPPTVVGDVVIVGSAIVDNYAVDVEPGTVRGFDARTGKKLWDWDPMPRGAGGKRVSAANAWSVLTGDDETGMVFIPTGAPAPDFYGGDRPGNNADASSVVALDARTGRKVWSFQLVHHDVWDYDVAAQPLLFRFRGTVPAVAVAAKTGILFVFNRLTGEPLSPITERVVPQSDIAGEHLSPTQPFSALPPLSPLTMDIHDLPGHTAADQAACAAKLSGLRYDGVYTPVSLRGTLQFPGSLGGVNWGSMSLDPATGVLYVNTNRSAYEVRLIAKPTWLREALESTAFWVPVIVLLLIAGAWRRRSWNPGGIAIGIAAVALVTMLVLQNPEWFAPRHPNAASANMVNSPDSVGEISYNDGAPYRTYRRVLQDSQGRPCTPQPWGATSALNLNTGQMVWQKPLGTLIAGEHTGTVNFGAPIVTAGGLLFTAASSQPLLRAIDKATGEEVWTGALPVPAQSTPMTYVSHGRQYIVVAAGGHGGLGTPLGDSVIAFALQ